MTADPRFFRQVLVVRRYALARLVEWLDDHPEYEVVPFCEPLRFNDPDVKGATGEGPWFEPIVRCDVMAICTGLLTEPPYEYPMHLNELVEFLRNEVAP